jgi:hypothetical protein
MSACRCVLCFVGEWVRRNVQEDLDAMYTRDITGDVPN